MKAILVIDMPDDCPECPMAHWNKIDEFTGCDAVSGKKYAINDKKYAELDGRPNWCPLKPIPEKVETPKIIQEQIDGWHKLAGEYIGWNACIDEILGEEK